MSYRKANADVLASYISLTSKSLAKDISEREKNLNFGFDKSEKASVKKQIKALKKSKKRIDKLGVFVTPTFNGGPKDLLISVEDAWLLNENYEGSVPWSLIWL